MTEDELMQALRQAARERRASEPGPSWDKLAADALDEEARTALLQSQGAEDLSDMFLPLGEDFQDQIVADLLAGASPPGPADGSLTPEAPAPTPTGQLSSEAVPTEVPAPANRPRWWTAVVPVVLVAAVLLVWFLQPGPGSELPSYTFEVQGGDAMVRGEPEVSPQSARTLSHGSALTLVGRPDVSASGELAGTVMVQTSEGLQRTDAPVQVASSGAVRWTGTAGSPPLVAGVDAVVLVVHPPDAPAADVLRQGHSQGAHVVRVDVKIVE